MTSLIQESPARRCSKCAQTKAASEFYRDPRTASGLRYWCKECCAKSDKRRERRPRYKKYGLSKEQFLLLAEKQRLSCACCGIKVETLSNLLIDHCHKSGKVRGLLCNSCNSGIGMLGDSLDGIKKAEAYLLRSLSDDNIFEQVISNA